MKKKQTIITVSITVFILIAGFLGSGSYLLLNRPLKGSNGGIIYVDSDDSADSVLYKLRQELHATSLYGLQCLFSLTDNSRRIHTGAYRISPEDRSWKIYTRFIRGTQTPVRLTLPSVRTIDRLARSVSRQLMMDSCSLMHLMTDSVYLARLGFNSATLPAFFLPNTYEVYWDMTPEEFMKRMKREYDRFWNPQRKALADSIGFSPVEVATLASIVDEETANIQEKPTVAGLYINRLMRNIPLQADPTVKFGLQDFGLRRILKKHLEVDSPYNTYKYAGLPPGPIRIASLEGIQSVLNYTRHHYLYMCAKEDFSGTHRFAESLNEHHQNARKYQKELNKRKIFK